MKEVKQKRKRKIKREKSEIVQKKRKNEEIDEDDYNEIQKDRLEQQKNFGDNHCSLRNSNELPPQGDS